VRERRCTTVLSPRLDRANFRIHSRISLFNPTISFPNSFFSFTSSSLLVSNLLIFDTSFATSFSWIPVILTSNSSSCKILKTVSAFRVSTFDTVNHQETRLLFVSFPVNASSSRLSSTRYPFSRSNILFPSLCVHPERACETNPIPQSASTSTRESEENSL